jgi:glycosyltransferase involved in cell wall biosynthesis
MMNNQLPFKEEKTFSMLLIGTQMATGGAQKGLLDQARWFKSHGCDVTVAFFYDKENLHEKWADTVNFPILNLHAYQPGAGLLRQAELLIRGLWRLWKLMMQGKFEVVETFTHDSNLLGLPFAWLTGVPARIATHRGEIENFPKWREKFHSWMINAGIANRLIAVSEQTRQKAIAEGVKPERVSVILSGIKPLDTLSVNRDEVRKELGLAPTDIFLLAVGRLMVQKGHDVFIQAISMVIESFPGIKAGICGDGPLRPQLESQIDALGLSSRVKLLGMRGDISPFLSAADIFVLPSRWEGLSRALLEAMASGLPSVATRVDGAQEVITNGVHGLLVHPDNPDELASSIIQLSENTGLRKRIGAAAQTHILKNYNTDGMCRNYYEVILKILNHR